MAFKKSIYRKYKKTAMGKLSRKVRSGSRKKRPTFAKKVMAVVKRAAEHKYFSYTTSDYLWTPGSAPGGVPLQIQLTPAPSAGMAINQGVGQGDRIGNRIKIIKAVLQYVLYPQGYDATHNRAPTPADVRGFIGRNKISPVLPPNISTALFQYGNTTVGFSNELQDQMLRLNSDVNTIYKQVFHKLAHSYNSSSSGGSSVNQFQSNNDYKMNVKHTIDITKYVPSTVIYNDGNTTPQTPTTWLTIWYNNADNTTPTLDDQAYAMWYSIQYTFEDM